MADITRLVEVVLQVVNRSRRGTRQFVRETQQVTTATRNAQQQADQTTNRFRILGGVFGQVSQRARNAGRGVRDYSDRVREASQETRSFGQNARSLIQTFAATGVFGLATRSAADFSRQIAEVGTLVDDTVQTNEQLRDTVRELSNEFGQDRATVASALYQAISSGAEAGAEANDLLRVALRLAIGGVTDARSAVDGLTTVLNAFQLEANQAEEVADVLFQTVRNGRTTVEELSQFLFQAAPIANTLGVSFEELSASIIGLTLQGTPARTAFTQIRAALLGVARDTPELVAVFREAGFASGEAALAEIGLAETLQILSEATGGSIAQIQKLVGTVEGAQAIAGLSGENFEAFAGAIDQVNNAAGASTAAFEEVSETLGEELSRTLTSIGNAFESIGTALTPVARVILGVLRAIADFVQIIVEEFPNATALIVTLITALLTIRTAVLLVGGLRAAFVSLIPTLASTATTAGVTATATTTLAGAVTALGVAIKVAVPLLAALAAGYLAASKAIDFFIDKNDEALASTRRFTEVQAEILALREQLEGLGTDAAQLEQQLQVPFARAFAAQDPEIRRQRLQEIRDSLQQRLELEQQLGEQIQSERERLLRLEQQREEEAEEARLERRRQQVRDLIQLDTDALEQARNNLRALAREEEQTAERIKTIRQESADFQESLERDIAAIGQEEEDREIAQARQTIALIEQLAAARQAVADARTLEQAESARQNVIELAGAARQLDNEDERLLRLREIQRLEEDAAAAAAARGQLQVQDAQASQEAERNRIEQLQGGLAQLQQDLEAVGQPVEIDVKLEIQQTNRELDQLEQRLAALRNQPVDISFTTAGTQGFRGGGKVVRAQEGGKLPGFGGGDRVPVMAEAGEMIVNKERTSMFGSLLNAINGGPLSSVGEMLRAMAGVARFQEGGIVSGALAAPGSDASAAVGSRMALDLTLNGSGPFALEGERSTITTLIDELSEATRNLPGR